MKKLHYVYVDIECAIMDTVDQMTVTGIKVDVNYLEKLSKDYHKELEKLRSDIYKIVGHEFNINSPQQLGVVLFDELKIGEGKGLRMKKTTGGARSTRESELEKLREHHPIVGKIFLYRELQKLLSTYIDTLPSLVGSDGRVHATFKQAGTTTGRFSSDNPNLQNIPVRSELGKKIRDAFIAEKGSVLVSFDYSQIHKINLCCKFSKTVRIFTWRLRQEFLRLVKKMSLRKCVVAPKLLISEFSTEWE